MNFKRLALLGGHAARGIAKGAELTPARVDLLSLLVNGSMCQRDLATALCVSEGVVSRLVYALMKRGLVERKIPVADHRYRIVSLTAIGREEFGGLATVPWTMEPAGLYDCQSAGERNWIDDWRLPLERMGLRFLAELVQGDHEDGAPWIEPLYAAMRLHHRRGCYRDPHGSSDFRPEWPHEVKLPPAPPLDEGLVPDPTSERILRRATIIRTWPTDARDEWRRARRLEAERRARA